MKNKVFIVIVTYNGIEWIDTCLNSIPSIYEIVIVDNNSTDSSVQFIKGNYPSVTLIQQAENLGFGGANNIGMHYALNQGADYVFLLNQDAHLQPTTIECLIAVHKENNDFGIFSPIHLNGNGDKLDFNFSNYFVRNKAFLFDAVKHKYSKRVYEVPFVNAAAWLVPKATLETIGGFDPIFYHYAEDDNYCNRVLFHQLKIGVVPNCYVYHDREFRKTNKIFTTNEKLKLKERSYKHKWSNINVEIESEKTKRKIRKVIFKLILQLKISKALFYIKELNLINKILPEIQKSRALNKTIGNHYLN